MPRRYCTMPKIPWFRNWFESKFGDLCEAHDKAYGIGGQWQDKIDADFEMSKEMAKRGYLFLSFIVLLIFATPFIKGNFEKERK